MQLNQARGSRGAHTVRVKVRAIMTADPRCAPAEATIAQVARLMADFEVGAVPILDENRQVVGIITDRDVCKGVAMMPGSAAELSALALATRPVVCCHMDDDVPAALRMMENNRIRRLPVVDGNSRLVGILSMDDVILCAGNPQPQPADTVTSRDAVEALRAIYRKRRADRARVVAPTP
jgi:CBS domain-containing protein